MADNNLARMGHEPSTNGGGARATGVNQTDAP